MIEFMAITNDLAAGVRWHSAGVQRIMIDLETFGKAERQKHRDTVKSNHDLADIEAMRDALPTAHLVVRCEPMNMPNWDEHVEQVLVHGPTSVMIPMIESAQQVAHARDVVRDRAGLIVMIETSAALTDVVLLMAEAPESTYFVGLNDLHVQFGQHFMFEPLADGSVDAVAAAARRAGAEFGFGGLARQGQGLVDSASVVNEHVRLGSRLAILARSFFGGLHDPNDIEEIASEIQKLRDTEAQAAVRSLEAQQADSRTLRAQIVALAAEIAAAE